MLMVNRENINMKTAVCINVKDTDIIKYAEKRGKVFFTHLPYSQKYLKSQKIPYIVRDFYEFLELTSSETIKINNDIRYSITINDVSMILYHTKGYNSFRYTL